MWLPLILLHIVVLRFLVLRGWRWMWAIPFVGIVLLFLWWYQRKQYVWEEVSLSLQDIFVSYGMLGAWTVLLLGIWQLLTIFGLLSFTTWFRLLWGHMLFYLIALFFDKKDIALLAHGGRRVSGVLIIRQATQFSNRWLVMDIVSMMISLSFAMYATIVFVIGAVKKKIDRSLPALLFIFSQLTILVGLVYYTQTITLWTLLGWQIYLSVLYGFLHRVFHVQNAHLQEDAPHPEDQLYQILRGEQITWKMLVWDLPAGSLRTILLFMWNYILEKLPGWSLRVLASINLFFMFLQLILVLLGKTGETGVWIDIWFWVSIVLYGMNYLLLQQQKISVWWQRFMTFLLINFGIYLTIYHIFGNVPLYLVWCGVARSLCNAVVMIHTRNSLFSELLTEKDYQYWLFGNMMAILANSYFIFLLPMSLQLRFTVVMIYLALQGLLLKYQLVPSSEQSRRRHSY